jgi:AAA domain
VQSTALRAVIKTGQVRLGVDTTIVHDEAALASTREQQRLLVAVEASGARLIEIGDPRRRRRVTLGSTIGVKSSSHRLVS